MRTISSILLVGVLIGALLLAGCTQSQPVAQPTPQPTVQPTAMVSADTIKVMDSSLGKIMTDANGMTLYYFTADTPASMASVCTGAKNCSTTWPPFSAAPVTVSAPLDPADFSSITRADGMMQTTYYGWPLYHFAKDAKPGDVNGENIIMKWHVVKPDYSVWIETTPDLGSFLTDQSGKTLYFFLKDSTGTSTCTGACLAKWPAFSTDAMVLPPNLKSSDFSTVARADGVKQSAFMGKPLYSFAGDTAPGMTTGDGVNNIWAVANITGVLPVFAATTTTPPTTVATTSPVSSGYSSGGGGY